LPERLLNVPARLIVPEWTSMVPELEKVPSNWLVPVPADLVRPPWLVKAGAAPNHQKKRASDCRSRLAPGRLANAAPS
jgi:hypothetical protein